jgi:hypothetical protein
MVAPDPSHFVQYHHIKDKDQQSTVQYSTVQYSTVQYTVQYSTVQYSTILNRSNVRTEKRAKNRNRSDACIHMHAYMRRGKISFLR